MRVDGWHNQFCKGKQLLYKTSPLTIRFYKLFFIAYKKDVP